MPSSGIREWMLFRVGSQKLRVKKRRKGKKEGREGGREE
jgi:hypothetical protein